MPIPPTHSARALVTGATGFLGRHLVRHLHADGWEVAVLTRTQSQSSNAPPPSFLYTGQTAEVMRAVADFRPDTVFHLASLFLVQHTAEQIEPLISSNVLLGTQLLEAMRAAGVHSLVNAGTAWQNFAGDAYLPVNLYASTKQAFEDILLYYVETGGVRAVTLKLFDSYGPDDTRRKLLRLLLDCLRSGEPLGMSGGEQVLDLVHVDDICRAFLRAAELAVDPASQTTPSTPSVEASAGRFARWSRRSGRWLDARCPSSGGRTPIANARSCFPGPAHRFPAGSP